MAKRILNFFRSQVDFNAKTPDVMNFIKTFMTQNMEALSGDGYTKRIVFGKSKRDELLKIYNVDENKWKNIVRSHPVLQYSDNCKDILNELLMCHYLETGNYSIIKFLSVRIYTSKYYKAFPKFVVVDKMKSTLNSLSNKYYIKKYGSMTKSIDALISTYLNSYSKLVTRANDDDIIYLINAIVTRVNLSIRGVQNKYYANVDRMFEDKEILDRDNLRLTTNDSIKFEGVIKGVIYKDITDGYDPVILKYVRGDKSKRHFDMVYKEHKDIIKTMSTGIIENYLMKSPVHTLDDAKKNIVSVTIKSRDLPFRDEVISKLDKVGADYKKTEVFNDLLKYFAVRVYKELEAV